MCQKQKIIGDNLGSSDRHGFFGQVAAWVMTHRAWTRIFIGLMSIISVVFATQIQIDANILSLLPPEEPTTQAIKSLIDEENGANYLTVTVRGEDADVLHATMDNLAGSIRALEDVEYVLYDLDEEIAWRLGLLQLNVEELQTIRSRLSSALALGPAASNPMIAGQLLSLGPITDKLSEADFNTVLPVGDGMARLLIRPTGNAYDYSFSRKFMTSIHQVLDEAKLESQGLSLVWIGGAHRHALEETDAITTDLTMTALLSFALVITLVGVSFRDLRAVGLIFIPLVIGTLWTCGYAGIAVGKLNTFTSFFAAILIGLGVDFSIHLYSRFREERAKTDSLEEAVITAWDAAGPPCATAAFTSAGGFCALWVAGFQGFNTLGTLLAGGVILCLAAVVIIMPLLILWREGKSTAIPLRQLNVHARTTPPTYWFAPYAVIAFIIVTVIGACGLPHIGFEYDFSELRREGMAYNDLHKVTQDLVEDSYSPIVVSYPDAETLLADHIRLSQLIEDEAAPHVSSVVSVHSLLPPDQDQRVEILKEIAELASDNNVRYLPQPVQSNLATMADIELEALSAQQLPHGLKQLLSVGKHHRLWLMPEGNMWDLRENQKLYDEVTELVPDRSAAGEYLAMGVLYSLISHDAPAIAIVALILVFFFAWFDLRNLGRACSCIIAVAAGMCWAGGLMSTFDIKLSMINLAAIPILMGIGIDVIIHLLHRIDEEGPGRIRFALATTGWAALLSTATTLVSFSALHIATTQGVRSMGTVIVLGLSTVSLAAFIAIPIGWQIVWRLNNQLPTDASQLATPAAQRKAKPSTDV